MAKKTQKQMISELLNDLTESELVELKSKLTTVDDLHSYMDGCYYYTPSKVAAIRRSYEEKNSNSCNFKLGSTKYKVEQTTSCSCNNVYYSLGITPSEKVVFNLNISFIRKIIDEINDSLKYYKAS